LLTQKKGSLRLAAATLATRALSATAGALAAILLSAGINKIIRVTVVTFFYCSESRTLENHSSFALR
jgi:hypothetical protein